MKKFLAVVALLFCNRAWAGTTIQNQDVTAPFLYGSSFTASSFYGDGKGLTNLINQPDVAAISASTASLQATKVNRSGDTMTGQLTLQGSTLTVGGNAFSVGASTLVVQNGNVGIRNSVTPHLFEVGSGTLTVRASGSVGILTETPGSNLDVKGSASFGQDSTQSTFTVTGALVMSAGSSITLSGSGGFITGQSSITASSLYAQGLAISSPAFIVLQSSAGINTANPVSALNVVMNAGERSALFDLYSNDANAPGIISRKARGTMSAPSAPLLGDNVAAYGGRVFNGSVFTSSSVAVMLMVAAENQGPNNNGTDIKFFTTPIGTSVSSRTLALTLSSSGTVTTSSSMTASAFFGDLSNATGFVVQFSSTSNTTIPMSNAGFFIAVTTTAATWRGGRPYSGFGRVQYNTATGSPNISVQLAEDGVIISQTYVQTIPSASSGDLGVEFSGTSSPAGAHNYTLNVSPATTGGAPTVTSRILTVREF